MKHKRPVLRFVAALALITICLTSGMTIAQTPPPLSIGGVAWSPDHTELAAIAENGVFIYDTNLLPIRYDIREITNPWAFGGWNPDGTKLLVGNDILDTASLNVIQTLSGYPRGWVESGQSVFRMTTDSLQIIDAATDQIIQTIPQIVVSDGIQDPIQLEEAVASPNGTIIASAVANGIFLIDVSTGIITVFSPPVDYVGDFVWSPDSSRIAFSSLTQVAPGTHGSIPSANADYALLFSIAIMDAAEQQIIAEFVGLPSTYMLDWSADQYIVGYDPLSNVVEVFDGRTTSLIDTVHLPPEQPISSVLANPVSNSLVIVDSVNGISTITLGIVYSSTRTGQRTALGKSLAMESQKMTLHKS